MFSRLILASDMSSPASSVMSANSLDILSAARVCLRNDSNAGMSVMKFLDSSVLNMTPTSACCRLILSMSDPSESSTP